MSTMRMLSERFKQLQDMLRTPGLGQGTETRWFGHISRSSGDAKTTLQGTVKGKRKTKRRTGMKIIFRSGQGWTRAAEDKRKWKGIVVKSSFGAPTTSQGYDLKPLKEIFSTQKPETL